MLKAIALALTILAFANAPTQAQYSDNYFEVGATGGIATYSGDLGGYFSQGNLGPMAGIMAKYNIGKYLAFRGAFNWGILQAADKNYSDSRKYRNLSFNSHVFEMGAMAEFNILGYHPRALESPISPYVFLGITGFYFSPYTYSATDERVSLPDQKTEGQSYSKIQMAIPMGIGLKYALNSWWGLSFEAGVRMTTTDYLDDVSGLYPNTYTSAYSDRTVELYQNANAQTITELDNYLRTRSAARGDNSPRDWYLFINVGVHYYFIDEGLAGATRYGRSKKGCKGAGF
jgi:hypothetical protein